MSQRAAGRVEQPINSLADLQLSEQTLDSTLVHIGRLALDALPGWDSAAATLIKTDRVATFGATDQRLHDLDQGQYDIGRGPCMDAFKTGDVQYYDGISDHPMWHKFAEAARDQGIHSAVAFPLRLDGQMLGALNIYSNRRNALKPGQLEEGLLFAAQASVTISNATSYLGMATEINQLELGLESRSLIGQAIGLLMAQEGLDSEEALERLTKVSQTANVKLREIAKRYVESWDKKVNGLS